MHGCDPNSSDASPEMNYRKRIFLRAAFLIASVLLATQILAPRRTASILPALSPLAALCAAITRGTARWSLIAAVPLLLTALVKGRWFCFHLCPTGSLAELVGRLRRKHRGRFKGFPNLGPWVAMLGVGGSFVGYPLFIWLDPLSLFSGFFSALRFPLILGSSAMGVGLVIVLLLNVVRPNLWCERLCPLGAAQKMLGRFGKWLGSPKIDTTSTGLARRGFLGIGGGTLVGWTARRYLGRAPKVVMRPPGSVEESKLAGLCQRCGNCVRACPTRIIFPDFGQSGAIGLLTPVVRVAHKYGFGAGQMACCEADCNECNKVCPTGAIRRLALDEKRDVAIGIARVNRLQCLAWSGHEFCLECKSVCPYDAIEEEEHNGVACPIVDAELCRGCGKCQCVCPATQKAAIVVHAVPQTSLVSDFQF